LKSDPCAFEELFSAQSGDWVNARGTEGRYPTGGHGNSKEQEPHYCHIQRVGGFYGKKLALQQSVERKV
jgi:hypothetical protein